MTTMLLSDPAKFPAQYLEICKQFIESYFNDLQWEVREKAGLYIDEMFAEIMAKWDHTLLADQLAEIARAAEKAESGQPWEDWTAGVTYEGIQNLCERLFCPPGLGAFYEIPNSFWETPLGQMVGKAFIWCQNDALITQAQAAELTGVTTQAIHQAIKDGRLRGYTDPDSTGSRQGRTLVSKREVEKLYQRG